MPASPACDRTALLGIYTLEGWFRPGVFRAGEYALVLAEGALALFRRGEAPNRTLGPCQLGLSTMLRARGRDVPLHTPRIRYGGPGDCLSMLRAASVPYALRLLDGRLGETFAEAAARWPERPELRRRRVGEEFNGQYAYGLMLEDVCAVLEAENVNNM